MSSDSWAAGAPTRCSSIYTPPLSLSCAIMRVRCYQVAPSRSSPTKIVPPFNCHPPALVDYWRTASHQKQATICYSCHASVEREMVLVNFHSTKHTDLPTNPPTKFPKPSASNRRQQRNICGDSHPFAKIQQHINHLSQKHKSTNKRPVKLYPAMRATTSYNLKLLIFLLFIANHLSKWCRTACQHAKW